MPTAKILLVEDDFFIRDVYTDGMRSAGFVVESAVDGEEALAKIKQGGWDVVLMDYNLPKMNGLEVLKQVKAAGVLAPAKHILFLTNSINEVEENKLKEFAEESLMKSNLTPEDLVEKVKQLLEV